MIEIPMCIIIVQRLVQVSIDDGGQGNFRSTTSTIPTRRIWSWCFRLEKVKLIGATNSCFLLCQGFVFRIRTSQKNRKEITISPLFIYMS